MELTIDCKKRPEGAKPNAMRRDGQIPAVLYGHKGAESIELTVDSKVVETLLKKAVPNNTIIQLNVSDLGWSGKTLLREVQTHPWKGYPYHLSFFSVAAHGDIDMTLPLHFVGEAKGVKLSGGTLDTVLTEVEVKCSPENAPEFIAVDVSGLENGDALHVNQLDVPAGVTILGEGDRVVVSVLGPKGGVSEGDAEA